jgi:hypothetical protein
MTAHRFLSCRTLFSLWMLCAVAAGVFGHSSAEAHSTGTDKVLDSLQPDGDPVHLSDAAAMRLKVSVPLLRAQQLLKQRQFGAALDLLGEIDAVPDRTKPENDALETLRIIAASDGDQPAIAAKAYDGLAAVGSLSPVQRLNFSDDIATAYFRASDYPATIVWANRYLSEGGGEARLKSLLAQAYYFGNDFANAARTASELIAAEERDSQTVTESQLQILANSAIKLGDQKLAIAGLEKLVAAYPKTEYWSALIRRVAAQPGFSSQLAIDVGRLRLAVGAFTTADDYMELAQQAFQTGFPAEAKTVLDKGFAAQLLTAPPHQRLRESAEKLSADDLKSLPASAREAEKQKTGQGLVNTGQEAVFLGQTEQGIALIERGLAKGGLKTPETVWLHLGEAHALAGQTEQAISAFRKVEGAGIAADLARLWLIVLKAKP